MLPIVEGQELTARQNCGQPTFNAVVVMRYDRSPGINTELDVVMRERMPSAWLYRMSIVAALSVGVGGCGGSGVELASGHHGADQRVLVDGIALPEGPLVLDNNVYFVSVADSKFFRWDGKTLATLNAEPNCEHNGDALTLDRTFLLACSSMAHPGIIETDMQGNEIRRWQGPEFEGGVNDIVVAKNGGVYASICGPFETPPKEVVGRVIYRAPGSDNWVTVAADLNYANGVGLSPDQQTLYVSETIGNSIKKFHVEADGSLSHRSNFALLNVLTKNKTDGWWTGPDSIKVDAAGNIYAAQLSGGRILKISPEGQLLHVFDIAAGTGTTNLAFDAGEKNLVVSVAPDANDFAIKGAIVEVPNQ